MVLYIIGLGLGTERDITLRGLDAIKSSSKLFLESYTSVLCVSSEKLEKLYEKPVTIATRDMVESECHLIVDPAKDEDVSFLVVGDPVCATTHTDIMIR
jgi:diphthine synthase